MAYWMDDGIDVCPEVVRAGTAAFGLYSRCGAWISRNLTDGFVPTEVAAMYGTPEWTAKLVAVGLWRTAPGGFEDVKYLGMNPSAEMVRKRRAQAARRQALVRDPALRDAVRARDKDRCRYCGVQVRWSDRKGGKGGTYDHVDPDGPNSYENLVVCCRSCNSSKRDRTPEQAGMSLRPAPNLDTTRIQPRSDSNRDLDSSSPPSLPPTPTGWAGGARPRDAQGAARTPDAHAPTPFDDPLERAQYQNEVAEIAEERTRQLAAERDRAHRGAQLVRQSIAKNRPEGGEP